MEAPYDSKADTLEHIKNVNSYLMSIIRELTIRAESHDSSKLLGEEKETFDRVTPLLKNLVYGSEEYKNNLDTIKPVLEKHYALHSHHPEHYQDSVNGMTLIDIIEMLCDWEAACLRTKNGDIRKSIEINANRFGIGEQLVKILLNTVEKEVKK